MASDLVLRLCQVDENDGGFPSERHIATHDFIAGLFDLLGGYHTVAAFKAFYGMTAAEQNQFDIFLGKITSAPQVYNRSARINRLESILLKWAARDRLTLPGYDTPDDIEAHILGIDSGF